MTGRVAGVDRELTRRRQIDPNRPQAAFFEPERHGDGTVRDVLTVLTTGQECRFRCTFCDLWRDTLPGPTPVGAIPRQLDAAFADLRPQLDDVRTIKLYNAGNWFDAAAVPRADWPAIAARLDRFARIVVESHPKLTGDAVLRFAGLLRGRLEVAMGLETIDDSELLAVEKRMTRDDFAAACERLLDWGVAVRAFVLLPSPLADPDTYERDRTSGSFTVAGLAAGAAATYAFESGASVVTLVPLRDRSGRSVRPSGPMAHEAITAGDPRNVQPDARVDDQRRLFVDLWDAADWCDDVTIAALDHWNRTQGWPAATVS